MILFLKDTAVIVRKMAQVSDTGKTDSQPAQSQMRA
jgi:hypothetical protein